MNRNAAKNIILAQVASDGGKDISTLVDELMETSVAYYKPLKEEVLSAWNAGYQVKDVLIENACKIVARHRDPDIRFFVTKDRQGIAKFIVYFDVKINGKRWQVSFHSFSKRWAKWETSTIPSRGNWDHKSSRDACLALAQYIL